ncbi:MAG: phosphotransferase family protein [Thermoanaerobaculia bacterium]|nr:phosphotransferase family protein [Thermoanaerobaculia bacterium]
MTGSGDLSGIDPPAIGAWFEAEIEGSRAPLRFTRIKGGHSNLTFRVDDATGAAYVLRRPPLGTLLATAHDMAREYRIITSLAPTSVPVAPTLGLCEDDTVTGAPFYVMRFVEGHVVDTADVADQVLDAPARRRLGERVVDVLADLHAVDPDAVGLGDLGKKQDYLARQLKRWRTQWQRSKTRELAAMEEIAATLERRLPAQIGAAIVHGDFRIGNMLVSRAGDIAAVLDWELCTLGDPLADLGYLLNNWVQPGETSGANRGLALAPTAAGGFPARDELVERYAERSGRETRGIAFYRAFQYWRSAAIAEGVLARYLDGKMAGTIDADLYRQRVEELAAAAAELLAD